MPFPLALAAGGSVMPFVMVALRWFFLANIAAFVARAMGVLGLAWFTHEYVVQPMLDLLQNRAGAIPAGLAMWLSAFAIDKVFSIVATSYLVLAGKRVVLGKRA